MTRIFILVVSVFCIQKITAQSTAMIGQACDPSRQIVCADPFAECANGACKCRVGYIQFGYNCVAQSARRSMLNDPCDRDGDCAAAWSYCKDRKCQCRPKYTKESNYGCKPNRYFCPISPWFNDPLKANGEAVECISYSNPGSQQFAETPQLDPPPGDINIIVRHTRQALPQTSCPKLRVDNCPVGTYCNTIHPEDVIPTNGYRKGVCCNKPKPMCPTGDPLSTDANEDCSNCPRDTHFCFCDQLTNVAACCPRSCPIGSTFVNGQCLASGPGGGGGGGVVANPVPITCTSDAQCTGGARCASIPGQPQKQCLCSGGLNYINGVCTTSLCASGQPLLANTGQIQTCSGAQPCPPNYQCDPTRRICCPNTGSGGGASSTCPPGQMFAGATCSPSNPSCPIGASCSAMNTCCQPMGK